MAVIRQNRDIGLGLGLGYRVRIGVRVRVRVWVRVCLINNYIGVHLYTSSNHKTFCKQIHWVYKSTRFVKNYLQSVDLWLNG